MTTTRKRQALFSLIALSLPLLFLLLAEGLLRVAGFGTDYPLFVEVPQQPGYLQPNPAVVQRFFADPRQAPQVSIDTGYFRTDRRDGSLRIVVQGGSSAAGFPYGRHASLAGHLQQRLARSLPGTEVEVILTAMAAVNSYALVEFAEEIVAISPDAVVIYAGHNEFLGILGVGSGLGVSGSATLKRLVLALRDYRVFQLMQRAFAAFRPAPRQRDASLMAQTARERSIPLDSPLFEAGVTQFRDNLGRLLRRYQHAGIPVFIGTLASNEKDQAPFLGTSAAPGFVGARDTVRRKLAAGDTAGARAAAAAATLQHPDAADLHYLHGRALLQAGAANSARAAFMLALDHDRLRFRAPTVFERVIRAVAADHDATVAETHARLSAASPAALIGNELMLEHLHPNAEGYLLLADAFYDALADHGLGHQWRRVSQEQARAEQPLTRIEQLHGEYRAARLTNDWPFVAQRRIYEPPPPRDDEQRIAQAWLSGELDWFGAMKGGLTVAQQAGDYREAARIAVNLATALPFEPQPQYVAGQMLVRQAPPDGRRALPYFHRAATLDPGNVEYLVTLIRAYWLNGLEGAARQAAQRLQRLAPDHPVTREIVTIIDGEE